MYHVLLLLLLLLYKALRAVSPPGDPKIDVVVLETSKETSTMQLGNEQRHQLFM